MGRVEMDRERTGKLGFYGREVAYGLVGPPLRTISVGAAFFKDDPDVNIAVGAMIASHAAAKQISYEATRRLKPLGERLRERSQLLRPRVRRVS